MPLQIGYWNIRGLAHPIRMMLSYKEVEFDDKRYDVTRTDGPNGPDFDMSSWFGVKFTLPLDFPNLPYLIDGDVKITQSNAVMRTIARTHGLCGSSPVERANVDMMADAVMDLRNGFCGLCYNPKFAELRDGYKSALPDKLKGFEKFLGDKKWLVGNELSFPDFHLYEMLDQHLIFDPSCLDEFPKLKAYKARFEAIPQIRAFKDDPKNDLPMNNKMAAFGNEII